MEESSAQSGPSFRYRNEGDLTLIEIKLTRIEQLFNSQMLLYDWWPITRLGNTNRRLSEIEVELRPNA